jgi:hypothetical protein
VHWQLDDERCVWCRSAVVAANSALTSSGDLNARGQQPD